MDSVKTEPQAATPRENESEESIIPGVVKTADV